MPLARTLATILRPINFAQHISLITFIKLPLMCARMLCYSYSNRVRVCPRCLSLSASARNQTASARACSRSMGATHTHTLTKKKGVMFWIHFTSAAGGHNGNTCLRALSIPSQTHTLPDPLAPCVFCICVVFIHVRVACWAGMHLWN